MRGKQNNGQKANFGDTPLFFFSFFIGAAHLFSLTAQKKKISRENEEKEEKNLHAMFCPTNTIAVASVFE